MQPSTIQALTAGWAKIPELEMSQAPYSLLQRISTMDYLTSLHIVDPISFTGLHMQPQPHVKTLSWQTVSDLSTEDVQHMICMLPALEDLSFEGGLAEDKRRLFRTLSPAVLAQAQNLEQISLFGLSRPDLSVSLSWVQKFELALRSQGEMGLAQPAVPLVMPRQVYQGNSDICLAVRCWQLLSTNISKYKIQGDLDRSSSALCMRWQHYVYQVVKSPRAASELTCSCTDAPIACISERSLVLDAFNRR